MSMNIAYPIIHLKVSSNSSKSFCGEVAIISPAFSNFKTSSASSFNVFYSLSTKGATLQLKLDTRSCRVLPTYIQYITTVPTHSDAPQI
ncbi:uncharacterized protein LAJ45_09621 [Morchella importuna]|uniref:uncharacterized protein n=1 Tax=Morchella importuna TaxID=1174673 RepID=UPI001E8CA48B|nr:uncharacterized protein LAJ45_09621 [Morchella importuna]KAH8146428.1 hypothetical protein LAJ45_09621 [Morchella importuna]